MRVALLVLLAVSTAAALKCYAGGTVNEHGVYSQGPCLAGEQYCRTIDLTTEGVHTVTKTCGLELCTAEGCEKVENGKICCCKGDLCNAPSPRS
ncbi:hypothetical protein PENTCL1PPCAC_12359 [Pristionchus entomophagus]|uniref:Snake toxin/toxin-like domain-containing protein n=1 Tax=Pristionchus entomophagus TaxID=358040 RepID=A0AAV5T4I4_9BILA|nr:hypothetical protein PENTCL1PPCAC_12359 [Pristionchus entomophagus]